MYTFKVESMSCGGCGARIARAIQAVDPEAKVEVALRERLVHVRTRHAVRVVADALAAAGYPAREVAPA